MYTVFIEVEYLKTGYQNGENVYIIVSGIEIVEVTVINRTGDLYTLRLPSKGAIRLKSGRLYETEQEAKSALHKPGADPKADFWEKMGPYKYLL